ncbi:sensor histidine kinase [Kineococcus glutinatus]|uniref:histidine kinase n=1 Tax=Kineococcus glutinatus TaxID=1070872 RepID=A0ABP9HPZ2_9ACTN
MHRLHSAAAALGRWRRHVLAVDAALAAPVVLACAVLDAAAHDGSYRPHTLVVSLGLTVPLAWRRAAPVVSAAVIATFALYQVWGLYTALVSDVAVLLSVYALAAFAPRWAALAGLTLAVGGASLAGWAFFGPDGGGDPYQALTAGVVMTVLALTGGTLGWARRQRAEPLRRLGRRPAPDRGEVDSLVAALTAWPRAHPFAVDAAGAGLLALVTTLPTLGTSLTGTALGLALVVPLAWRRTATAPAAAVTAAAALAQLALSAEFLAADVAVLFTVYALAAHAPRWARRGGLVLALLGAPAAALRYWSSTGAANTAAATAFMAVLVVAAHALGVVRRARDQHVEQLAERARLLELERANEARLAATTERQRIAREMHDVVAHSLSVIIAQADGGRYAARSDPAAAVAALDTIAGTGRQALTDMRALLGVLRQQPGSELLPQPDADRLPELVESVRRSGLDVRLDATGTPRPLPAGTGLAAYRIVQESLTNVLKHSGPASRAVVAVRWDPDRLRLEVTDDGRGAAALTSDRGPGQGIVGMRERAALHGGTLRAGPLDGGGFGVSAELPYPRGS